MLQAHDIPASMVLKSGHDLGLRGFIPFLLPSYQCQMWLAVGCIAMKTMIEKLSSRKKASLPLEESRKVKLKL